MSMAAACRRFAAFSVLVAYGGFGLHALRRRVLQENDCAMTHMWPTFTPIDVAHGGAHGYRTFLFKHGSHPAYASFRGAPLVFVPGHLGEYRQVRSLGAELFKLGGGISPVDVFVLDLNGEPSALHPRYVARQAEYLVAAIKSLSKLYPEGQPFFIVAHSYGGNVARLALRQDAALQDAVAGLITIGTPHREPAWAPDLSTAHFYAALGAQGAPTSPGDARTAVPLLAISGGWKDGVVPLRALSPLPGGGRRPGAPRAVSTEELLGFSVDHRAQLWCSQLVKALAEVIAAVAQGSDVEGAFSDFRTSARASARERNQLTAVAFEAVTRVSTMLVAPVLAAGFFVLFAIVILTIAVDGDVERLMRRAEALTLALCGTAVLLLELRGAWEGTRTEETVVAALRVDGVVVAAGVLAYLAALFSLRAAMDICAALTCPVFLRVLPRSWQPIASVFATNLAGIGAVAAAALGVEVVRGRLCFAIALVSFATICSVVFLPSMDPRVRTYQFMHISLFLSASVTLGGSLLWLAEGGGAQGSVPLSWWPESTFVLFDSFNWLTVCLAILRARVGNVVPPSCGLRFLAYLACTMIAVPLHEPLRALPIGYWAVACGALLFVTEDRAGCAMEGAGSHVDARASEKGTRRWGPGSAPSGSPAVVSRGRE